MGSIVYNPSSPNFIQILMHPIASLYSFFRKGHGLDIYYNKWGGTDDVFHVCGLFVPCLIGKYMFVLLHACHLSMYSWFFILLKTEKIYARGIMV